MRQFSFTYLAWYASLISSEIVRNKDAHRIPMCRQVWLNVDTFLEGPENNIL